MTELLQQFGRRLRIGMVGGGKGSVIGRAHLLSLRADGYYDLVAGAMSSNPATAVESGRAELIAEERIYADFRDMATREAERDDGIDVVVIATPPQLHLPVAEHFLQRGIHVVLEKPFTRDLNEARRLEEVVTQSGVLLCLTHCYTGYPIVRHARDMVASGALGQVQLVEAELSAGPPGLRREPEDPSQRHWRFRASSMGKGAILGEVSSHACHILGYVTGLAVAEVSAELNTFVPNREVYDNAYVTARFENGARGRIWGSYVASGNDHGLWFRIYGEKAGLKWVQEDPEVLWFKPIGEPAIRLARGYDVLSRSAQDATRLSAGHPEGYIMAFANLYSDFARAVISMKLGIPHDTHLSCLPGVADGVASMAFIEAASRSNERNGEWVAVEQ